VAESARKCTLCAVAGSRDCPESVVGDHQLGSAPYVWLGDSEFRGKAGKAEGIYGKRWRTACAMRSGAISDSEWSSIAPANA
jgi:hypothetical protein